MEKDLLTGIKTSEEIHNTVKESLDTLSPLERYVLGVSIIAEYMKMLPSHEVPVMMDNAFRFLMEELRHNVYNSPDFKLIMPLIGTA